MKAIATASVSANGPAYGHTIHTGRHELTADEPLHAGGQDTGPAPYDLVLSGLGACTAITLRMYADRKGWDLGEVRVDLRLLKNREGDTRIERTLFCSAELTDEQWAKLLEIASKTPVTRTLEAGAPISSARGGQ